MLKGVFICKKCGNIQEFDIGKECELSIMERLHI